MRVRYRKQHFVAKRQVIKDAEGSERVTFGDVIEIRANIFPAGGKVQAEFYGNKINYMANMLYDGSIEINEGDGIYVNVLPEGKPDYKVISKKIFTRHVFCELEKI